MLVEEVLALFVAVLQEDLLLSLNVDMEEVVELLDVAVLSEVVLECVVGEVTF